MPESTEPAYGLRWGIKRSFIDYVGRMPDGKGSVGGGAIPVGVNEVLYAPDTTGRRPGTDGDEERFWSFLGDVRFSGHFGMLFVRVAGPTVTMRGAEAELTVEDPFQENESSERLLLATLRLEQQAAPDGMEIWNGSDVQLAETGTELFNNVYPPGEPFEPLTLTLPIIA